MLKIPTARFLALLPALFLLASADIRAADRTFNVREYGATGVKKDNAQPALQKAVDACAAAGGGTVLVPAGEYSTGTIHLRSHVRIFLESGATLYSIKDKAAFDKDNPSLFYAEDVSNITLDGRGTVNGQAGYVRRLKGDHQDDFIYPNQVEMEKRGLPLMRSFPKEDQYGHLILFVRCKDIRITGLSFIDSPSWTVRMYGCERVVIDGVYIHSSLKDGVWADGIDPDGCKDVRIANSTIETGDDALVFYSMNWFGPALPCENITVTNCRLSSASSAIKFCDGNMNAVRNVTISNCVITNSNRGLAFMNFDGGVVENVTISDLVIDCVRFEWFWWGDGEPFHFNIKKPSEVHKSAKKEDDHPAGVIRNVLLRNIIARGYGPSVCNGHPDSWLDGITLDNVKLFVAHDPASPYDKTVHALTFKQARNLKLRNVEIFWDKPAFAGWESALVLEDVQGLTLDGVETRPARPESPRVLPAVVLKQADNALIRNCRALPGTGVFLGIEGDKTRDIIVTGNDFRAARAGLAIDARVPAGAVRELENFHGAAGESRAIKKND